MRGLIPIPHHPPPATSQPLYEAISLVGLLAVCLARKPPKLYQSHFRQDQGPRACPTPCLHLNVSDRGAAEPCE